MIIKANKRKVVRYRQQQANRWRGRDRFEAARNCFEICLCCVSLQPSVVVIEQFKPHIYITYTLYSNNMNPLALTTACNSIYQSNLICYATNQIVLVANIKNNRFWSIDKVCRHGFIIILVQKLCLLSECIITRTIVFHFVTIPKCNISTKYHSFL